MLSFISYFVCREGSTVTYASWLLRCPILFDPFVTVQIGFAPSLLRARLCAVGHPYGLAPLQNVHVPDSCEHGSTPCGIPGCTHAIGGSLGLQRCVLIFCFVFVMLLLLDSRRHHHLCVLYLSNTVLLFLPFLCSYFPPFFFVPFGKPVEGVESMTVAWVSLSSDTASSDHRTWLSLR